MAVTITTAVTATNMLNRQCQYSSGLKPRTSGWIITVLRHFQYSAAISCLK